MRITISLLTVFALAASATPARAFSPTVVPKPAIVATQPLIDAPSSDVSSLAFDGHGNATALFTTSKTEFGGTYASMALHSAIRPFGATEFDPARDIGPNHPVLAPASTSVPLLAVDAAGNATAAWVEGHNASVPHEVFVADRPAGAADFSDPVQISGPNDNPGSLALARGNDGTTTVVWLDEGTDPSVPDFGYVGTVRARVRTATSNGFQATVDLSPPHIKSFTLSSAPDGGEAVGWARLGPDAQTPALPGTVDIHVARKAPGSGSFAAETQVSSSADRVTAYDPFQLAQQPGGVTTVVWGIEATSTVDVGNGILINMARTIASDGSMSDQCRLPATGPADYSWGISALGSDSDGNVTAVWADNSSLGTVTKRAGQPCFDDALQHATGLSDGTNLRLAADARGSLFVLDDGVVGYRPPLAGRSGSAIPGLTGIDGFSAGGRSPSMAVDPFGNVEVAWTDRYSSSHTAILDRTPPTITGVTQAPQATSPPVKGTQTILNASATDTYSPTLSFHWAFSNGTTADGQYLNRAFATDPSLTAVLTVTDAAGNAASQTVPIQMYVAPPKKPTTITPPTPSLSLTISKPQFSVVAGTKVALDRGPVAATGPGASVTANASMESDASFALQRFVAGHVAGGRCRSGAPSHRHPKRCSALSTGPHTARIHLAQGSSTIRFTGVWGKKPLSPGRYRLTGELVGGVTSLTGRVEFTITR